MKRKLKLSDNEIIQELEEEIKVYKHSYREADGKVRIPSALRTIAALSQAIEIIRGKRNSK